MNTNDESLVDIFHGYSIEKMKYDLEVLDKVISKTTVLLETPSISTNQKCYLDYFLRKCKLMKYRIENRIKIIENDDNIIEEKR